MFASTSHVTVNDDMNCKRTSKNKNIENFEIQCTVHMLAKIKELYERIYILDSIFNQLGTCFSFKLIYHTF